MSAQTMKRATLVALSVGGILLIVVSWLAFVIEHNSMPWVWVIFAVIDFPISLLTFGGYKTMLYVWGDVVWNEPWRRFSYGAWPILIHGVFGSIWWGAVSRYLAGLLDGESSSRQQ